MLSVRYSHTRLLPLSVLAMLMLALAQVSVSCSDRKSDSGIEPPPEVKAAVKVVGASDPKSFASICSYPVMRPYPLRDIVDSSEMVKYYDILVDDSLRNIVRKADDADWSELGWRGWTLDDGQYLWLDEGSIYDIPYISEAEKSLRDILVEHEMQSLPDDMQEGWTPAECLHDIDDGAIYRIDRATAPEANPDSLYRLSIYPTNTNLFQHPATVLRGYMATEGSAAVRTYYFRSADGGTIEYTPDSPEDGEALSVVFKTPDQRPEAHRVAKAYWRDWFAPSR